MTQEIRKKYSSLMDGGMHQLSSSDSDEASTASAFSGEQDDNTDLDGNQMKQWVKNPYLCWTWTTIEKWPW